MILVFPRSCGDEFVFSRPSFPALTTCGCNIGFDVAWWSLRPADRMFLLTREFRLGRCNLGLSRLSLTPPKLSSSDTAGLEDCRDVPGCFCNLCCSWTKSVETLWF